MKTTFQRIIYGGDYNPNQWDKEVWSEDMRIFENADINSATVNVFSWGKLQPSENEYNFTQLDEIIQMLSAKNYDIVLATSTAALPAWMFKNYPEVARTDIYGRHHKFGQRHNACPNSPIYQRFAAALTEKLAQRYADNKHVTCWHVNNEYGGTCYCENCEKAFRVWLKDKYKTLQVLNKAWNTEFWGHTINAWDEIVVPTILSEALDEKRTTFSGISLDYCRFNSDSMLNNFMMERDIIRRYDIDTPITTNLMGTYKELDYFKWAREMDIVSWDNYPSFDTPWSRVAMCHDLMRGLKSKPFMLMEQTPSQQNWQPYNSLKRPGQMRAQSFQTIAHGGDTIQFFQLRRSAGACEKFHGAVIEHSETDNTRVFREVAQLGHELKALGTQTLGTKSVSRVGVVFDWDNYWALEYASGPSVDLKYVDQIHQFYEALYSQNIAVDMINVNSDFTPYSMIVAPVLYMVKEDLPQKIEQYLQNGGTFLTGFMSGIVNESDNVHLGGYPGPLRKMAGVWAEEIDALAPSQSNSVQWQDSTISKCTLLCDLLHLEGAQALANYTQDFYAGMPAITKNSYGKGTFYYVGTQLEPTALAKLLCIAAKAAGVKPIIAEQTNLEITCREDEKYRYWFIINFTKQAQKLPAHFDGKTDLLKNSICKTGDLLPVYTVLIIKEEIL